MIDQLFAKYSTHHLAKRSGVPDVTLWRWRELGTQPRLDLFVRVARAAGFNVTLTAIDAEKPPEPADPDQLSLNFTGAIMVQCRMCGDGEEYRSKDHAIRNGWKFNRRSTYCKECRP